MAERAKKFRTIWNGCDITTFLDNFLSTSFYDLKVTFGYIGESPENSMSKYTQEV